MKPVVPIAIAKYALMSPLPVETLLCHNLQSIHSKKPAQVPRLFTSVAA